MLKHSEITQHSRTNLNVSAPHNSIALELHDNHRPIRLYCSSSNDNRWHSFQGCKANDRLKHYDNEGYRISRVLHQQWKQECRDIYVI